MSTTTPPSTPNRRWYQFSLRSLLVAMLLFCLTFGWVGSRMRRARVNWDRVTAAQEPAVEESAAVAEIAKQGGTVDYGYEARRPQTWLEALFDDPGDENDPAFCVLKATSVSLSDTGLTDADLEQLSGLSHLQQLDLRSTNVTDAGLEHLRDLPNLKRLYLDNNHITDAGLEQLRGMTGLQVLNLWNTDVTDDGVKKLRRALPNCKIYYQSPRR